MTPAICIYCLPLGELQANCYIVHQKEASACILIDPGDDTNLIKKTLSSLSLTPEVILLTHGHFDHMLGAAHIKNEFGAKLYISEKDEIFLSDKTCNLCPEKDERRFLPCSCDGYISEGGQEFCGIPFTIIPTPGHTPGGVCLYIKEEGVLFSGDTLFSNGFGRTDFIGGDWAALFRSLKTLFALPPETMVYPGHGAGAPVGDIRKGFYR